MTTNGSAPMNGSNGKNGSGGNGGSNANNRSDRSGPTKSDDAAIGAEAEAELRAEKEQSVLSADGEAERRRHGGMGRPGLGTPVAKSANFGETLRRLLHLMSTERFRLLVVVLMTVGSVVLVVLGPRLLGQATDVIFSGLRSDDGIDYDELHRRLFVVAGIYAASFVLSYGQGHLLAGVVQRSMYQLRQSVEEKLDRLPLDYIDSRPSGDLLSRVTNDIDNLAQSLQQTVSQILTSLLTLVGVAIMMFTISPLLAVVALGLMPPAVFTMRYIGSRARPRFVDQWATTGELNSQVEEVFTGHDIVKAFGRQHDVEAKFEAENDELYQASFRAQFVSSLIQPSMLFMSNVQYVAVAVVGGMRITSGAITVGDMQAMIQYARQFSMPLTQVASMATVFQSGIASLERVLELLDAPEQTADAPASQDVQQVKGRVEFNNVDFSYDPDKRLIEGLTVVAEPGQTVAIVGPTGAGKTTLVNLIMRFYELDSGVIRLDGRDITSFPRRELRSQIGMVLQDTWLFSGTIRENLAYGNPEATEAQIQEAARVTFVDRFVHSLPDGYDTMINEEGDNISAGEKQLLTIARAFLADPAMLILDEATSSVDTRTEVLIQEAMNALRANRTSFVIAHRLSTIRGADVILVMEDGSIVEQGSHDELIEANGAYARLHQAQFAGNTT